MVPSYTPEASRTILCNESCKDVIGNLTGNNPLHKRTVTRVGGFFNGDINNITYINASAVNTPSLGGYEDKLSDAFIQKLLYPALAKTGLSAPTLQLPVAIFELKDIPQMLLHAGNLLLGIGGKELVKVSTRYAGDSLESLALLGRSGSNPLVSAKEAAAATLAFQFGWKPLIDDIRKLLDFRAITEKRLRQLDRAYNGKTGYHGRSTLYSESKDTESMEPTYYSTYFTVGPRRKTVTTSVKAWAVVPWCPKERPSYANDTDALKHEAFMKAFGLNVSNVPLAIWKALPWSWFVDYFTNIGEYLTVQQNLVDFVPQPGVIMVNRKVTTRIEGFSIPTSYNTWLPTFSSGLVGNIVCDPFESISDVKNRVVVPSWPTGSLATMKVPILDTFKLSVLGSLAILSIAK